MTAKGKEINQKKFLAAYRVCGNISRAAKAAKIDRRQHYTWLDDDADYKTAFNIAHEDAIDMLEDEARRRAIEGTRRFKFHNGKPIRDPKTKKPYSELDYSDTLLIFLLKGARPDIYRDNSRVQFDGSISHAGKVNVYIPDNGRQDNPPAQGPAGEVPSDVG